MVQFLNKRISRIVFIQYIFSEFFFSTQNKSIDDLVQHLREEDEDVLLLDTVFVNELMNVYKKNHMLIIETINIYNHRRNNNDILILAILQAACCEFFLTEKKVVISEYIKIAHLLGVNIKFINAILDQIAIHSNFIIN